MTVTIALFILRIQLIGAKYQKEFIIDTTDQSSRF